MGSNQSRLGRSTAGNHHPKEKKKNKKSSGTSVNSKEEYEHLTGPNDNSARSSPSDVCGSTVSLKDGARKNASSSRFCLCFQCSGKCDEPKCRDDPVPGYNGDSVALLRVSSRSSLHAVEPEDGNSSFPEEVSEHRDIDEGVTCEILAGAGRETSSEHASDFACTTICYQPAVGEATGDALLLSSSGNGAVLSTSDVDSDVSRKDGKRFLLSKKYLSFPCGLFGRLKSVSEGSGRRGSEVTKSKDSSPYRGKNEANEPDCLSNGTSCEDSGKASESEVSPFSLEPQKEVKAPIAKIDSLETTSIDSLGSDDLMLDMITCSYTNVEEPERRSPEFFVKVSSKNLNQALHSSHPTVNSAEKKKKQSRSSPLELTPQKKPLCVEKKPHCVEKKPLCVEKKPLCLEKIGGEDSVEPGETDPHPSDLAVVESSFICQTPKENSCSRTNPLVGKERNRQFCPFPVPPLQSFSDVVGDRNGDSKQLCHGSFESFRQQTPPSEEEDVVVMDRETYSGFVKEVELCRKLLLDLEGLICQNEVNSCTLLDLSNTTLTDPSCSEDFEGSVQPTIDDGTQDRSLIEQLTCENDAMKRQVTSLQTIVLEQRQHIASLEAKLVQWQKPNNDHCPAENHSVLGSAID